jgi:hypothetical protein
LDSNSAQKTKYHAVYKEAKEVIAQAKTQPTKGPDKTKKTDSENQSESLEIKGSAAVVRLGYTKTPIRTCFMTSSYVLGASWILDSGSDNHICNAPDRFVDGTLERLEYPEPLLAGSNVDYITGRGEVLIRIKTPDGDGLFRLKNVLLVEGFHTNVVSHRSLRRAGYMYRRAFLVSIARIASFDARLRANTRKTRHD